MLSLTAKLLNDFSQQDGSWRYCVYFMEHSRSEYVLMYSTKVLEVRECFAGMATPPISDLLRMLQPRYMCYIRDEKSVWYQYSCT